VGRHQRQGRLLHSVGAHVGRSSAMCGFGRDQRRDPKRLFPPGWMFAL
jgi:hypothetical protein